LTARAETGCHWHGGVDVRHRWGGDLLVAFTQAAVSMLLALATMAAPMLPPAPGLLSMTTGWPQVLRISSATSRATMSVLPPAENPTTMVIWRLG